MRKKRSKNAKPREQRKPADNKSIGTLDATIVGQDSTKISLGECYQCNLCQSTFDNLNAIEVHIRNHLDDTPYRCYKCRSCFWSIDKLIDHSSVKHASESQVFMCKFCLQLFDTGDEYRTHDATHTSELGFDCLDCGKVFETNDWLVEHRHQIHIGDRLYACRICDQRFTRTTDMTWHIRKHSNLPSYECKFCAKMFARVQFLSNHVQRAHKGIYTDSDLALIDLMDKPFEVNARQSDEKLLAGMSDGSTVPSMFFINQIIETLELIKKFKCPVCHIAFVKEETVEIHCKRNHPGTYGTQQIKNLPIDLNGDISTVIPRQEYCPACNGLFPSKSDVVGHLRTVHNSQSPFKCKLCDMLFSRAKTLEEHVRSHFSSDVKCHYCNKTFRHKVTLNKHIIRHVGADAVNCSICNVPYGNKKLLENHFRSHLGGRPHECDYCPKRFTQSCDKTKHMRIHTGDRPYKCDVCQKAFAQLTSVRKHRILHTDERNFQCSVCGKSFRFNSNLTVHMRTHTGDRPYLCKSCGKSFTTSGHLNEHVKIHEGKRDYKCNVCHKTFVHSTSYTKHKRMHTGEKPFHCAYCNKYFSQIGHYKEHVRIHTNERPYHCAHCDSKFRRKDALTVHLKSHRKDSTGKRKRNETGSSESGRIETNKETATQESVEDQSLNEQNRIESIIGSDGFTHFSYTISLQDV